MLTNSLSSFLAESRMNLTNSTSSVIEQNEERLEFSSVWKIATAIVLALVTNCIMCLFHSLQSQADNNKYRLHNVLFSHLAIIIQVGSLLSVLYIVLDSLRVVCEEPLDSLVTLLNYCKLRTLSLSLASLCGADLLERLAPRLYLGQLVCTVEIT